jgi:hypothetical protein
MLQILAEWPEHASPYATAQDVVKRMKIFHKHFNKKHLLKSENISYAYKRFKKQRAKYQLIGTIH